MLELVSLFASVFEEICDRTVTYCCNLAGHVACGRAASRKICCVACTAMMLICSSMLRKSFANCCPKVFFLLQFSYTLRDCI